jgi:hypothetical protein
MRTSLASLITILAVLTPGTALAAPDTQPPTVPTNLRVQSLSFHKVDLAWNPSTDNSGWVMYEVEVRTPPVYAQRYGALGTTKEFSALAQGTTYTASVLAVDGARNKSAPVTIQFTTPVDTLTPAAPLNPRQINVNGVFETLAWDPAADNSDYLTYFVWSNGIPVFVQFGTTVDVYWAVFIECAVERGSIHTLTVTALDGGGNMSPHSAPLTVTFPS